MRVSSSRGKRVVEGIAFCQGCFTCYVFFRSGHLGTTPGATIGIYHQHLSAIDCTLSTTQTVISPQTKRRSWDHRLLSTRGLKRGSDIATLAICFEFILLMAPKSVVSNAKPKRGVKKDSQGKNESSSPVSDRIAAAASGRWKNLSATWGRESVMWSRSQG